MYSILSLLINVLQSISSNHLAKTIVIFTKSTFRTLIFCSLLSLVWVLLFSFPEEYNVVDLSKWKREDRENQCRRRERVDGGSLRANVEREGRERSS